MKVTFLYDEDKDIECLITKGGSSTNSPKQPTKAYLALLEYTKDINDRDKVREFVRAFRSKNIESNILKMQQNWDNITAQYEKRAEAVFGISLSDTVIAYLTITGRFPYSIQDKYFFVAANKENVNAICMHELWHFYTWHKFCSQQEIIGASKYNEIKEALTVILNIEYPDLMGGEVDNGYPQHRELRAKITEKWNKTQSIDEIWKVCVNE